MLNSPGSWLLPAGSPPNPPHLARGVTCRAALHGAVHPPWQVQAGRIVCEQALQAGARGVRPEQPRAAATQALPSRLAEAWCVG